MKEEQPPLPPACHHLGKIVLCALVFLSLLVGGTAYGQEGQDVSGRVTDAEQGGPLVGVNVRVVGTQTGTVTDADGRYELTVPSGQATLRFSFVGYETRTVEVMGRSTIDVTLEPTTLTGDEVVVTGYTEQRRADITGAVDVADVEAMQSQGFEQVTEQMQGQVSGVSINASGQPGDQPQINIRGFNTFGNNQPLFVVDGMPTQNTTNLNPQDIESLQVLKDAASASQYGTRASNGVVVITTRGGGEEVQVNYNANFGYQVPATQDLDLLSPQEQGELEWLAQRNSGIQNPSHPIWGSGAEPDVPEWILPARAEDPDTDQYFVNPNYTDPDQLSQFTQFVRANQDGTNWFDAVTDPAAQTQHHVSVSGGGDQGSFYTSGSYTNQQGVLMNTRYERYSVRVNTNFNVTDNFRIGENLTFTQSNNLIAQPGSGALQFMYNMHTIIPVRDIRGNFAGTQVPSLGTAENPVANRARTRNDDQRTRRLFGKAFVEVDMLQNLTLRGDFGVDLNDGFLKTFQFPTYEQAQNNSTNRFTQESRSGQSWNGSVQLSYDGTIGSNHNVSAIVATEAIRNLETLEEVSRTDFFSFDDDFVQLGTGAGTPAVNESIRRVNTLYSVFGNIDYNYDNTYLLGVTLRRDGTSKFVNDKWGTFPAVSVGWRASELPALEGADWLTDLKLRGSWGIMGNQLNVDPANGFTLFGSSPQESYYPIEGGSNSVQQGIRRVRIGNPDATWESTQDLDIGVDIALFDGQLEASVDYYRKDVEDMLFNPPLPATAGAAEAPVQNVASMSNQGVDVSLRSSADLTEEAQLTGRLTFTTFQNEIDRIAQGIGFFSPNVRTNFSLPIIRNEVGHPISSFYGFDVVGFWQSEQEIQQANDQAPDGTYQRDAGVGRFRYRDVNGDGQITLDDRTHLGSPHPDFSYGLDLSLTYRNWDLRIFAYGEQGRDIWNLTKTRTDFRSTFNTATSEATLDSWTPNNRDAEAPIQELTQNFSTSTVPNSYFLENASFLRLKNVKLGYTLPSALYQRIGVESLRFYLQARNLLTITPYSELNPDIGATGAAVRGDISPTRFGVDSGSYPVPRTFTIGVNLNI